MLKLVVRSEEKFRSLQHFPLLKKFFLYDLTAIESIRDDELAGSVYKTIFVENSRTSKHTEKGRFRDADTVLIELLAGSTRQRIHDVAVSSGITSLELLEGLRGARIAAEQYISDKYATVYAGGRHVRRIYDANLKVMKYQVFNVLADKTTTRAFPLSILLYHVLASLEGDRTASRETLQEIKLYDPAVRRALHSGALRELYYDIFETRTELRFTCVRAMNILNRYCFGPERLLIAIRNLADSLEDGGLLQVGRTLETGKNTASFYRKDGARLVNVRDLNGGSELKPLIEAS